MALKNSSNGSVDPAQVTSETADKAVHVVLGAPVAVADYVTETVERLRKPSEREKELSNLKSQVERGIEVAEKRGVEIRKQLPSQVERGITIAGQRSEEIRQQLVEQAKVARERVEPTVRKTRERVEPTVRRTVSEARDRGRQVSDTTQEQLRKTQQRVSSLRG